MKKTIFSSMLIMFSFMIQVHAIDIIAPGISGLIEKDGKGVYQLLIKEAAKRAMINYKEYFFPQKRALLRFFSKDYMCIYA